MPPISVVPAGDRPPCCEACTTERVVRREGDASGARRLRALDCGSLRIDDSFHRVHPSCELLSMHSANALEG
jgi:hypothetical protein